LSSDSINGLRGLLHEDTYLERVGLKHGPPSIETEADAEQAMPEMVDVAERAHADYDAIVVACVGDAGVPEVRARSCIPVIGPGEAAMQAASVLASRFSIIVATENGVPEMARLARGLGFGDRLASVRTLGIPIEALTDDQAATEAALVREAQAAAADGAGAAIVGCTAAADARHAACRALATSHPGFSIIEPLSWSVLFAEAIIRAGMASRNDASLITGVR
jgi:allantoin racemase